MFLQTLCIAVLATQILASPYIADQPAPPQIVNYQMNTDNMPNSYSFQYEDNLGGSRTEEGGFVAVGTEQPALQVLGTVRWYDDKGDLYEMTYKAGKRGYNTVIRRVKQ